MKITRDQLKGWGACRKGYEWFLRRFPDGEAEYQDVLNALAEDDLPSDADWLMNNAGPDREAVLEVEVIANCKHLFAAGRLVIKNGAAVTGRLRAGWGIEAGEGIKAGWGIEAGEGINAGEGIKAGLGIKAGWGYGIFAGLCLRLSDWTLYAKVIAKDKPENLVSGSWVEPSAESCKEHR